jgi:hemoglobin
MTGKQTAAVGIQPLLNLLLAALLFSFAAGCATTPEEKKKEDFFTSGSPDADRRAEKTAPPEKGDSQKSKPAPLEAKPGEQVEEQKTLYERLGETAGIRRIVDDFLQRVLEDPRVNWTRRGVAKKGWFRSKRAEEWEATPQNINRLKLHFIQFISLAAGGPSKYEGKPIGPSHLPMHISKAEFDATIGDLKATLDHLNIPNPEQKDLLSIFESTRQQIVMER